MRHLIQLPEVQSRLRQLRYRSIAEGQHAVPQGPEERGDVRQRPFIGEVLVVFELAVVSGSNTLPIVAPLLLLSNFNESPASVPP